MHYLPNWETEGAIIMRQWCTYFLLFTKRLFQKPIYLFVLLLLPCFSYFYSQSTINQDDSLNVALYIEGEDELAKSIVADLLVLDSQVNFYEVTDYETLTQDVITRKAECAYIFPDDLSELLDEQKKKDIITVLHAPSSILMPISNEIVFSSLFRHYAKNILLDYALNYEAFDSYDVQEMTEELQSSYEHYMTEEVPYEFKFTTLGKETSLEQSSVSLIISPIRGIFAVLMFLTALFSVVDWFKDQKKQIFLAVSYAKKPFVSMLSILVPTLFCGIFGQISLLLSHTYTDFLHETVYFLTYLIFVVGFCYFIKSFFRNGFYFSGIIPVFTMGSLIFAPVFFDFGSLFPIFKLLEHLFLPAYFLNSFFVSGYYALGMFLGGGIFLILGIRLERLRQL